MKNGFVSSLRPAAVSHDVISEDPIDLIYALSIGHDPKAGAVVLFSGEVRNHSHKKNVSHLEYEAYTPMARKAIREIVSDARGKWNLHQVVCIHRIGKVEIGESAVVVVTSSSHREDAYAANRYIIDRVKHEAPIWKKEYFEDGSYEWGHNCSCHKHVENG